MFKIVFFLITILVLYLNQTNAILRTENPKDSIHKLFSARHMGQSIAQCFGNNEIMNCLENEIIATLDKAIQNNETWHFNDFVVIEKNTQISAKDLQKLQNVSSAKQHQQQRQQRSLSDSLALKMLQLAQTRSLKLQLPSSLTALFDKRGGISAALDDFITTPDVISDGDTADANPSTTLQQEEGRKKKDKDKNMAMMGGMAMMAMVAQMFLGKVILIAGAAFIMAKIALLVSVLGSLKKGSSGSSGSTEHVIVTGGGGGGGNSGSSGGHSHEHSSGWHRSMPYDYNKLEIVAADEHKPTEPVTYYEISENDEFKRRRQSQPAIN